MDKQPDQLSRLILETDGLLLLLLKHRDETPLDAIRLIRRKLKTILDLTEEFDLDEPISLAPAQPVETPQQKAETLVPMAETPIVEKPQPPIDTTPAPVAEYIENTIEATPRPEPVKPVPQPQPRPQEPVSYTPPTPSPESRPTPAPTATPTPTAAPAPTVAPTPVPAPAPIFMDDRSPVAPIFFDDREVHIYNEPREVPSISTVVEPRHHSGIDQPRRHVSSVFNLNDKFRFRRELFGNSDALYVECLDTLSAMTSLDEAVDYLYGDLRWDSTNDDVKAFTDLLANYYK